MKVARWSFITLMPAALLSLAALGFSQGDVSLATLYYSKPEYRPVLEEWKKEGQALDAIALLTFGDARSIWKQSQSIGQMIEGRAPQYWSKDQIRDLSHYILLKSKQYNISPLLVMSLIEVESQFHPEALSPKGAMGLMQVMPSTAQFMAAGDPGDLNDPKVNIDFGLRYMFHLRTQFKKPEHVITAYNIGPAALAKKLRNGEAIPLGYYQKVMEAMRKYKSGEIRPRFTGSRPVVAQRPAPLTNTMSDRVVNPTRKSRRSSLADRNSRWL